MGKYEKRINENSRPMADSILSLVNNLPPAGGEDLQGTVEEQNEAINELMKMVKRKVADHKGEGEYVWKKMTAKDGEFIDYVVSSDNGAFPNGGNLDGYWYEFVNIIEYTSGTSDIAEGSALATNTFYFVTA